jgi:hypothetical protein
MRAIWVSLACAFSMFGQPSGWVAMGAGGAVQDTGGGIVFSYDLQPKNLSLAVLPATPDVAHMQRLRFRVKTGHDTPLAVMLGEKKPGGGNYTAVFWAPAKIWQQIELTPADFSVSDGPRDPVDADGKLDLDEVEGIGIADVAQFFLAQSDNPDVPIAIDRSTGARTIEIAGFEIVTGGATGRRPIDSFDRGFLEWVTTGGVKMQLAPRENPLRAPAMQATTVLNDGRFGLVVRRVSSFDLAKATRLTFDVASENETTLVISLEMKNGKRFTQTVYPPGKREAFPVSVKLSDFEGDGRFDPAQWKSIAIADTLGQPNTIWIAKVAVE